MVLEQGIISRKEVCYIDIEFVLVYSSSTSFFLEDIYEHSNTRTNVGHQSQGGASVVWLSYSLRNMYLIEDGTRETWNLFALTKTRIYVFYYNREDLVSSTD